MIVSRARYSPVAVCLLCLLSLLPAAPVTDVQADTLISFTDAHTHIARNAGRKGLEGAVPAALRLMDQLKVTLAILAPPPFPPDRAGAYGARQLSALVHKYPGRFAFTAGGDSLNPLIQEVPPQKVTPNLLRRFDQEAEAIVRAGGAGFGELTAEHFSSRIGRHPYESAPPDHPLFLALADIAAKSDMPIELHMEAVPQDMPFPNLQLMGPPNPAHLKENISAFERLLDHNAKARIVWLHAGWDLTGQRTVPLMRSLLERHPNLYMSLKSDETGMQRTSPFGLGGEIKPGWVALLRDFPNRFVIGSDQFFDVNPQRIYGARKIVDALPPDLARLVASENVKHIYHLPALPP